MRAYFRGGQVALLQALPRRLLDLAPPVRACQLTAATKGEYSLQVWRNRPDLCIFCDDLICVSWAILTSPCQARGLCEGVQRLPDLEGAASPEVPNPGSYSSSRLAPGVQYL